MDGRTSECKGWKVDVPTAERTSQVRTRSGNAQKLEKPSFKNTKLEQDGWGQRNLQGYAASINKER